MDSLCREVLSEFVSQESTLRCLELCGYTNLQVLQSITEQELDTMEQFIRDTCRIMPKEERTDYVGAIFADNPELFRFPIGIKKGILMGVGTSKTKVFTYSKGVQTIITGENLFAEAQQQLLTSLGLMSGVPSNNGMLNGNSFCSFPFGFPSPGMPQFGGFQPNMLDMFAAGAKSAPSPVPNANQKSQNYVQTPTSQSHHPTVIPQPYNFSTKPSRERENGHGHVKIEPRESADHMHARDRSPIQQPFSLTNGKTCSPMALQQHTANSSPNQSPPNESMDSEIDVDKLKSRSSASVLRLSSKQFENAQLQEGTDFEIQLEITAGEDGGRRVSGVYQCHLCKVKRDRTSAVRFSIAKNRYPVVSNIMSHLKMHYTLRPVASQSPMESQAAASMMQMSNFPSMVPMSNLQQMAFWNPTFKSPGGFPANGTLPCEIPDSENFSSPSPWSTDVKDEKSHSSYTSSPAVAHEMD